MRKYFAKYGDFANTYSVCYTENEAEESQAIEEGMERISVIIGDSIPCAEPHQAVGCLCYVGNRVGGKSVDDGEFANIAVGESHNLQ